MAWERTSGKPISADSADGRLLLALRAGPHTRAQLAERDENLNHRIACMKRLGLVAEGEGSRHGEIYLTEAGRTACPTRRKTAEDREKLEKALYLKGNEVERAKVRAAKAKEARA